MNLANRPWKLYLRLAAVGTVVLAALIVLVMNRSNYVRVWFFGFTNEQPVNVVWLMLSTALGTITAWRVFAFSRGIWRDLREPTRQAPRPGIPVASAEGRDRSLARPENRPADVKTGLETE